MSTEYISIRVNNTLTLDATRQEAERLMNGPQNLRDFAIANIIKDNRFRIQGTLKIDDCEKLSEEFHIPVENDGVIGEVDLKAEAARLVNTPYGTLKAYPKNKEGNDDPICFPGFFVDLVRKHHADEILACVEYLPDEDKLSICPYPDVDSDAPDDPIKVVGTWKTFFRFELAFDGEPQDVGLLQGLEDVGLPTDVCGNLYEGFASLKSPDLETDDGPVSFWFSGDGLEKYGESIDLIQKTIIEKGWSLIVSTMKMDASDMANAVYQDEYQAAWTREYVWNASKMEPFESVDKLLRDASC